MVGFGIYLWDTKAKGPVEYCLTKKAGSGKSSGCFSGDCDGGSGKSGGGVGYGVSDGAIDGDDSGNGGDGGDRRTWGGDDDEVQVVGELLKNIYSGRL